MLGWRPGLLAPSMPRPAFMLPNSRTAKGHRQLPALPQLPSLTILAGSIDCSTIMYIATCKADHNFARPPCMKHRHYTTEIMFHSTQLCAETRNTVDFVACFDCPGACPSGCTHAKKHEFTSCTRLYSCASAPAISKVPKVVMVSSTPDWIIVWNTCSV